jgi:hypothetical protein
MSLSPSASACPSSSVAPQLACEPCLEVELPLPVARRSPPQSASCAEAALPVQEPPRPGQNSPRAAASFEAAAQPAALPSSSARQGDQTIWVQLDRATPPVGSGRGRWGQAATMPGSPIEAWAAAAAADQPNPGPLGAGLPRGSSSAAAAAAAQAIPAGEPAAREPRPWSQRAAATTTTTTATTTTGGCAADELPGSGAGLVQPHGLATELVLPPGSKGITALTPALPGEGAARPARSKGAEAMAVSGSMPQPGNRTASACRRCGGSGMLRLGDQRYRTCLDCLGSGQLLLAGGLGRNRLSAAASSVGAG